MSPNSTSSKRIRREDSCKIQEREDKVADSGSVWSKKKHPSVKCCGLWVAMGNLVSDNPGQGQEMCVRKVTSERSARVGRAQTSEVPTRAH